MLPASLKAALILKCGARSVFRGILQTNAKCEKQAIADDCVQQRKENQKYQSELDRIRTTLAARCGRNA